MFKKNFLLVISLIVLVGLAACSAVPAAPTAGDGDQDQSVRTISVNGMGRVTLSPDIARISIGVQTEGENASEVVSSNSNQASKVIDTLKDFGIAEKDVRTTNFSIFPRQDRDLQGNITGVTYVVQNTVNVTVRDLDDLGGVLEAVVQVGANNISGIQFDVADRSQASDDALQLAVQDARSRAETLAQAAGVSLGEVQSISSVFGFSPGPFPVMAAFEGVGGGEVPISPGEMEVSADVTMVFEIQ